MVFTATRELGRTGIRTLPIALGCYSMSNAYGDRSDAESEAVIRAATERDVTIIDTADFYGFGHNETLVATALQGRRDGVILSSKFGYVRAEQGLGLRGDAAYVKESCDASLRRLGVDCIDLYFQHRVDPKTPIEETVGAMAELVQAGKIRFIGLCEVSEATLRRACAVHPVTAVQAEYSLWTRDVEARMLSVFEELGVTLMAFSPLARGMLTGQVRSLDQLGPKDVRRSYPRFSPENFPKNVALVDRLGALAERKHCTLAQLALSWLFHADPKVVAICGCDTLQFLDENLGALAVELTADEVSQISSLFEKGQVAGDRYGAALMKMLED